MPPPLLLANLPGRFSFNKRDANYLRPSCYRRIGEEWVFVPWKWHEKADNRESIRTYTKEEQLSNMQALLARSSPASLTNEAQGQQGRQGHEEPAQGIAVLWLDPSDWTPIDAPTTGCPFDWFTC
jgi:hypothetical protein